MTTGRDPARVFHVLLHHPAVQTLVAVAREAGHVECHLVGGVLRDRFLGLPGRDLDAVVAGRGAEIASRLASRLPARLVHLGGKAFGAYRLLGETAAGPYVLDLWDREDTTLAEDLARRDFTVDSLALSAPGGELIDPHGGLADLRARRLRATGPESFTGDPLRVLRLPRLLVQLPGFTADPVTLALARSAAPRLTTVASERVRDELALLFSQPDAARGMAVAGALEVYPGLWLGRPGEASPEPAETGRLCHELGRLGWAAQRLRELAGGAPALAVDHRLARVSLTFVNLPADADRGATLERVAEAGYLTGRDRRSVARLLPWTRLPAEAPEQRRFLHRLGTLWPTVACFAGVRSESRGEAEEWERAARELVGLVRRQGEAIFDPPQLLDGREVGEILGAPPGPEIGKALDALRWAQVDGKIETKAEARDLVAALRAGASPPT